MNEIYKNLTEENFPVSMIHGELTTDERKRTMNEFKSGQTRILLSTDLLSRGIDIQQVSTVINFDLPNCTHIYLHRIGRSGRFGRKGLGINLIKKRDIKKLRDIEYFYSTSISELPEKF